MCVESFFEPGPSGGVLGPSLGRKAAENLRKLTYRCFSSLVLVPRSTATPLGGVVRFLFIRAGPAGESGPDPRIASGRASPALT